MRYISTRGEAPILGFIDATLAGLARDGGLYVPETWPRLEAQYRQRLPQPVLREWIYAWFTSVSSQTPRLSKWMTRRAGRT